ncbi:MAG: hypothetical protein ACYTG5_22730 [Planctomycetota bacterium]|jgi:hypothetical protein
MKSLSENGFHWLMGALLLGSCFLDPLIQRGLPSWDPPLPSLVTVIIGLIWVGRFASWRLELEEESNRVLKDRVERLERKTNALEDELRARSGPFTP